MTQSHVLLLVQLYYSELDVTYLLWGGGEDMTQEYQRRMNPSRKCSGVGSRFYRGSLIFQYLVKMDPLSIYLT